VKFVVTINISGHLKDLYPHLEAQQTVELEQPVTVSGLIAARGISSKMVLFATIDDRIVDKQLLVEQSCTINLISPPAGG